MTTHDIAAAPPTRIRYRVLALVCSLSMITYLDRVCFGTAIPFIVTALGLSSEADLKWAITLFAVAYGAFEIPVGRFGDRWGPRGTLLRIVVWWSICTALTGLIGLQIGGIVLGGLTAMIVLRFLFGAGEAGAYPNITRAVHNWFPTSYWETAQGMVWMSGRLMGGLTPLLWAALVVGTKYAPALTTWRGAFLVFGVIGLAWCALFAWQFRNRPEDDPRVNAAERALIGSGEHRAAAAHGEIPWRAMFRNRSLWAVSAMYLGITYGWFFNISYLPNYLLKRFPPTDDSQFLHALYQGGPLWVGALGCIGGGLIIRRLTALCGDQGRARRLLGTTALSACAVCWYTATTASNIHVFAALVSLAALLNDLTVGAAWATCQDLGRRHAAVTAAWMNTVGTAGAACTGWITGTIVQSAQQTRMTAYGVAKLDELPAAEQLSSTMIGYDHVFLSYAVVYFLAALCWQLIDPKQAIEND